MIFRASVARHHWLTLVVRAPTHADALKVATEAARQYVDPAEPLTIELDELDPDGPTGVLVDDPS